MDADGLFDPGNLGEISELLEDRRYAVACVKARIVGEPLPAKRPPCFFNPAHGPSSQDVSWAPPGGVPRSVPACPADAERVLAGADPYIRTVQVGAQRVPYWEGGQAYAPWAQGYYSRWSGSDMLSGMLIGGLLFGGMGNMFSGVGEGVGDLMGGMGDGASDVGSGIGDMFGDIFEYRFSRFSAQSHRRTSEPRVSAAFVALCGVTGELGPLGPGQPRNAVPH